MGAFVSICMIVAFSQVADERDLVKSIEQQRGGRHWIDQPVDPPKTPSESLACFEIEPGYRIDLVASEPLVFDPVAMDFDHLGRMFVAEYSDYPVGPADASAPALSRIVVLNDTDGDGTPDERLVFADHLKFCHSLMAFRDGVLACTETQIVYLPDADRDHRADRVEVWFEGFTPAHPQMQIGCPRYGLDNWIYLTYGHGKVRCVRPGFESAMPVDIPRMDFRFHPDTMKFEAISGAGQFGQTIDSFGHRYFSSNRNPIMTDVFSQADLRRNPFAGVSAGHTDVGPAGEKTRVYPIVPMKSNWLSHAGTHTSACGVTAYRGALFGPESDRFVFVCEPVGHLVTRSVTEPEGGTLTARRGREQADFLTSSDTWFRPASLATGPDGALYLADMYRLWVEHPKFVPEDVAARMDWRAGEDRGRIWRILPESAPDVVPFRQPESTTDLVAMLHDANGWRRLLAQRRLIEERRTDAVPLLVETLLRRSTGTAHDSPVNDFAGLHALWTLHGLNALTDDHLAAVLQSKTETPDKSAVQRDALRICRTDGRGLSASPVVRMLAARSDGEVQLQAILTADWTAANSEQTLQDAVRVNVDDIWVQRAWLISAPGRAADLATAVVAALAGDSKPVTSRKDFLKQLSVNVALHGEPTSVRTLLQLLNDKSESGLWWQAAIVEGLGEGLPRRQATDVPKSLAALMESPPESIAGSISGLQRLLKNASESAIDRTLSDADRIAAIGLMSYLPPEALASSLLQLLQPGESSACQRAAIEAVRRSGRSELTTAILDRWDQLTPPARSGALDLMLLRKESASELLKRMVEGSISSSVVSIDQRLILLQHPEESVRTAATRLFGGTVSADRKDVASKYAAALEMAGDRDRGAAVFSKTCSKCHRIGATGFVVGPDISDTRARARDALMYDILDPNRRVDPQFSEYVVVTKDGRLLNGLLISESSESITLRQPEGREQTLARSEVEEMKTTNKSLMPEGIERDVTIEQMADLLAFLKG